MQIKTPRIDTIVDNTLSEREIADAKQVYVGSAEQSRTYVSPQPYAQMLADLIGSMQASSVLEFGCNAGRNLNEVRKRLPGARLKGVDVNPDAIAFGRAEFGLDLEIADEDWLASQPDEAFDVSLTVSVIDHMPYCETVLRHLLRVTKHYLVLFELAHDRIGKATHHLALGPDGAKLQDAYRYSYVHDYRQECERKFGAACVVDAKFPIGADNLLNLYRLYVFGKQPALATQSVVDAIRLKPIGA